MSVAQLGEALRSRRQQPWTETGTGSGTWCWKGKTFYRMQDLKLSRDRALSLSRSWGVMHVLDEASPLRDATPEALVREEAELQVLVVGLDDTSMQPVHATHQYSTQHIAWGARLVDLISEVDDGTLVLDLRKFHEVEPTLATSDFPYSYAREDT